MERRSKIHGIIGIDIGGTNIRIGYVDSENQVDFFQKSSSRKVLAGGNPTAGLVKYIESYMHCHGLDGRNTGAISLGLPSTLNLEKDQILSTPNIAHFDNIRLAEILEREFGLPAYLDRDVNMIFRYDMKKLGLKDQEIGIGCYIGTGIGNVVCVDGKLLAGKDGAACELGHVPVMGRREMCRCGNEGCYENYASGRYLEGLVEKEFPGLSITEVLKKYGKHQKIMEFIDNIAVCVATEVNIFNPDFVILGGGVIAPNGFPREELAKRIICHARKPYPAQGLRLCYSSGADESGVIGSAVYARLRREGGGIHDCSGK